MRLVFFHSYDCAIIEWCVARPAKSPTPTFTPVRGVESISLGRPEARSRRMAIRVPRLVAGERGRVPSPAANATGEGNTPSHD